MPRGAQNRAQAGPLRARPLRPGALATIKTPARLIVRGALESIREFIRIVSIGPMARILITGGAGYVGSHCAKALAERGHEGVVFDNLRFGHRELVRWGKLIEGDVRDAAALDAVFAAH